jgi:hypothetical protein
MGVEGGSVQVREGLRLFYEGKEELMESVAKGTTTMTMMMMIIKIILIAKNRKRGRRVPVLHYHSLLLFTIRIKRKGNA